MDTALLVRKKHDSDNLYSKKETAELLKNLGLLKHLMKIASIEEDEL